MKKLFAAVVLLVTFSVPALAGWIDQTGRVCDPEIHQGCIFVEGSTTNNQESATTSTAQAQPENTETASTLSGVIINLINWIL